MGKNKFFNNKITIVSFIAYILLTVFIFTESLLSGAASLTQSGSVSEVISNVIEFLSGNTIKPSEDGKDNTLYPESISIIGGDEELKVGESYKMSYSLNPKNNYTLSKVTLKSSDASIVKIERVVEDTFIVTAMGVGTATITATDSFSKITATKTLTVGATEYFPIINFENPLGFSSEDSSVYFSPSNSAGAVYSVDYKHSLTPDQITLSYDENKCDAVLTKEKIYFYPKTTGNIALTLTATFDNVNGKNQTKTYDYNVLVKEKLLPSYTESFVYDEPEIAIKTSEVYKVNSNYQNFILGLEEAQKRIFYIIDEQLAKLSLDGSDVVISPKKVGSFTLTICYPSSSGLIVKKSAIAISQGVPKEIKIVAPSTHATRGTQIRLNVVGDGIKFNPSDFYWTVEGKDVTIGEIGNLVANKNGTVKVTAKHKTVDGFETTLTLTVKTSWHTTIRKLIGHFGLFLVLAVFASVVYYRLAEVKTPNKKWLFGSIFTVLAGILTAGLSEFFQSGLFVAGRAPSFTDVLLDVSGYLVGILVFFIILFIVYKTIKKKSSNLTKDKE
ncbi:MAG: VanZ family protein [Clostridiales bacterium]|nr:VanZ family protein [Clostridiales bacterium]